MTGSAAWRETADGLDVFLRVTPNAGMSRIDGIERRDDGSTVLRIRVTAPPDKGKANKAVLALLAKALGVPKSSIEIVAGETARQKTVHVTADAGALAQRLGAL